ncbi:M24 family metallopeptidase [Pelagibacteraceae bacterium]|nr:M24 family metallopeptidase [Pelagibacteraceae bacterium]
MNFPKSEYTHRHAKVKKSMQEKGIDLLISQDTANMNYLTGYDAWSFYYAQCVLVHIDLDEPFLFVRDQDAGGAFLQSCWSQENIIVYAEKYIHTWPNHPYDYLIEIIKNKKWDNQSIGLEMDSHYFTAFCYQKLIDGLPDASLKDSERLVNWVRFIKSDNEIELMKNAALITDQAMQTAIDTINPGIRQCDAVGEIQKAMFYGTPEIGGEYSSIATLLPTGAGTSASHLTATHEKFVKGEATIVELAGVHKRYHAPLARTVLLGKAEQKKMDAIKATNEALDEGISAIKPGNTADDVAQKFWAVLDKHDIKKESRTGYSIGIGYPPDWGEHTINISKGDQTILHPNVTFHMIAVMQFGSWGVEASHSLRVTENGSEKFSDFSSDLFIKD